MPEISIVIPVYNGEAYIRQCISSIQKQSIKNLEIVCIDDGSADQSLETLINLAQEDKRIIVLRQCNLGAGAARNLGIEKARGDYLAFLDADDYFLNQNALEKMVYRCREYGVNACGSVMNHNVNGIERKAAGYEQVSANAKKGVLLYRDYQFDYDFTTFIFRRSCIVENQVRFPTYRFFEDPPFLVKALFCIQEFVIEDVDLYCYRVPDARDKMTSQKCVDLLEGLWENMRFAVAHDLDRLFEKTLARVEYEYCDRICHNLSKEQIRALVLLLEINGMVSRRKESPGYVIRPLRKAICQMHIAQEKYEQYLADLICGCGDVYIYGAGLTAQKFIRYLRCRDLYDKVKAIIVSSVEKEKPSLDGITIISFQQFRAEISCNGFIFLAVGALFSAEIVKMLEEDGFFEFEVLDTVFLNQLI